MDGRPPAAASEMPQSEHERLKMSWDRTWGPSGKAFRHKKTAVLQLSWTDHHDDLKVGREVKELGQVFQDVYGFSVQHVHLDAHKAQQQALMDLAAFVHKEDEEGALLIIYYAGHGHGANVKSGDVRLEGKTDPGAALDEKTSIVWSKAEWAIRDTEADILLIFDCCDAGRLGRPIRNGVPKSYFQFLGACSENETTMGPGQESFTRALIWALRNLAKEGSPFSTPELRHKILSHDRFPTTQMPILTERRAPFENITISIQGSNQDEASELAPSTSEREKIMESREHIDLRFHFDHTVQTRHIEHTAQGLKELLQRRQPHWARVSFLAKSSEYLIAQRVANKWRKSTQEHRKRELSVSRAGDCLQPVLDVPPSESPASSTPHPRPFHPPTPPPHLVIPDRDAHDLPSKPGGDRASHISGQTETGDGPSEGDADTIAFHLRAIAWALFRHFTHLLSQIARWLGLRSDYERIPDEDV